MVQLVLSDADAYPGPPKRARIWAILTALVQGDHGAVTGHLFSTFLVKLALFTSPFLR